MRMASLLVFALVALVSCVAALAPLHIAPVDKVIMGSYIVVLHANVSDEAKEVHMNKFKASKSFSVQATWTIINGYHAVIADPAVLRVLLEDDAVVDYVEEDALASISYIKEEPAAGGQSANIKAAEPFVDSVATQNNLPGGLWGLGRIWQSSRGALTSYRYWASAGAGTDVYILDTGLNAAHVEFTGRVVTGANFVTGDTNWPGTADGNGHGTHVASTSAGTTYGVAKKASVIPVKVLSSSGSGAWSGIISGVDWVATSYRNRRRPSVANMSLGGGATASLDTAVTNAIAAGVSFVVAAGNDNANACNYSPARTQNAITVGSTTNADARSSFSNFGNCVDIFAPGSNILGAWYGSATATSTISGTSMASPHVCGAVSLYMGHFEPPNGQTPAIVKSTLSSRATSNVVTNPGTGSPNRLLFTSTTQ
eukprot:TRINITY_DN154_c0_g1_i7.p1 TRINITY_DN154_c0_g1~~TRINITY_DN154_c0_g1_i7.p1  ORF type:complete len:451 (-),score=114.68 TRINITY_DN154_c0_g1_i7:118-1395(-)